MRGELAFEPALRERVALLAGLDIGVVDRIVAERITLTSGGAALVRTMRRDGGYAALVSGGFTVFTGPISRMIGFDEHRSNVLVAQGAEAAGLVEEPILGKEAKLAALLELRNRFGLAHGRHAGGGRRRQRSRDAGAGRPRRRLQGQARGGRRRACAARPRAT